MPNRNLSLTGIFLKNQSTAEALTVLREVSFLQSTLAELPAALTSLETDLRNKGGFVHMQRLHNMIYMYGATIVEIVRRKEFSMSIGSVFDFVNSSILTNVRAKASSSQRRLRSLRRSWPDYRTYTYPNPYNLIFNVMSLIF
jgi:autophagy-related protein 11